MTYLCCLKRSFIVRETVSQGRRNAGYACNLSKWFLLLFCFWSSLKCTTLLDQLNKVVITKPNLQLMLWTKWREDTQQRCRLIVGLFRFSSKREEASSTGSLFLGAVAPIPVHRFLGAVAPRPLAKCQSCFDTSRSRCSRLLLFLPFF